jgi:hypothetical protein
MAAQIRKVEARRTWKLPARPLDVRMKDDPNWVPRLDDYRRLLDPKKSPSSSRRARASSPCRRPRWGRLRADRLRLRQAVAQREGLGSSASFQTKDDPGSRGLFDGGQWARGKGARLRGRSPWTPGGEPGILVEFPTRRPHPGMPHNRPYLGAWSSRPAFQRPRTCTLGGSRRGRSTAHARSPRTLPAQCPVHHGSRTSGGRWDRPDVYSSAWKERNFTPFTAEGWDHRHRVQDVYRRIALVAEVDGSRRHLLRHPRRERLVKD